MKSKLVCYKKFWFQKVHPSQKTATSLLNVMQVSLGHEIKNRPLWFDRETNDAQFWSLSKVNTDCMVFCKKFWFQNVHPRAKKLLRASLNQEKNKNNEAVYLL